MTLILQSWQSDTEASWVGRCLKSVRDWAEGRNIRRQFEGDEIFDRVPKALREKLVDRPQVATDLARLQWIEHVLATETDKAIWLDADVLVFAPDRFKPKIGLEGYVFGREVWVERDGRNDMRVRRNVHNAIIAAERGNSFIPFYRHAAERLLHRMTAGPRDGLVPQVIGPKLLGALHSIVDFPLTDQVAMISPTVLKDIAAGGGTALEAMKAEMTKIGAAPPAAANLCQSLVPNDADETDVNKAIDALLLGEVF